MCQKLISFTEYGVSLQLTDLIVHLRDFDWVSLGALAVNDGERSRAVDGVGNVVNVIGRVKVLAVPAADYPPLVSNS